MVSFPRTSGCFSPNCGGTGLLFCYPLMIIAHLWPSYIYILAWACSWLLNGLPSECAVYSNANWRQRSYPLQYILWQLHWEAIKYVFNFDQKEETLNKAYYPALKISWIQLKENSRLVVGWLANLFSSQEQLGLDCRYKKSTR